MLELGSDVEADAVQAHPAAHAHPDARDLGAADEDADRAGAPLALDAEAAERRDQPILERGDEGPHVASAPRQVEHHISHALAGAVIGEAPAAAAS